jgi:hypothetical protein
MDEISILGFDHPTLPVGVQQFAAGAVSLQLWTRFIVVAPAWSVCDHGHNAL